MDELPRDELRPLERFLEGWLDEVRYRLRAREKWVGT